MFKRKKNRTSYKIISEYAIDVIINGKKVHVVCQYKACKYLKIKYLHNNELIIIAPHKIGKEELNNILSKYEKEIIKLMNVPKMELNDNEFLIFGSKYDKDKYSLKEINNMYTVALEKIKKMFYEIQEKYNFPKAMLYFRKMRSRWGVCYPTLNKIGLSTYLTYVPKELIEYVILHEFCHFKYPNHSKNFYLELEKYSKNHKDYKKQIKYYSNLL